MNKKIKFTVEELIEHVEISLNKSDQNISKLTSSILSMRGMSGKKTRHLYNNICELKNANYLEIGTWQGSSFISSIYENELNAVAVDDWTEFSGPKKIFFENVKKYVGDYKYNFIEKNCFEIAESDFNESIDGVDIFLYDGAHDYESQKKAITFFYKFFSKFVIIMIDDWRGDGNWNGVIQGTYDGIEESGIKIHKFFERKSTQETNGGENYWNGVGIFICEKIDEI